MVVSAKALLLAAELMTSSEAKIGAFNLFRDNEFLTYDNSVRRFPSFLDFSRSYLGLGNKTFVNKDEVHENAFVDWAAGSLLMFDADTYRRLTGFNEEYFMYCEDVDICWRALKLFGVRVFYMPRAKAIHHAQFNNRRFFSKHFFWHIQSALRFLAYRYGLYKIRSEKKEKNL